MRATRNNPSTSPFKSLSYTNIRKNNQQLHQANYSATSRQSSQNEGATGGRKGPNSNSQGRGKTGSGSTKGREISNLRMENTGQEGTESASWAKDESESEMSPGYQNQLRLQQGKDNPPRPTTLTSSMLKQAGDKISSIVGSQIPTPRNMFGRRKPQRPVKKNKDEEQITFQQVPATKLDASIQQPPTTPVSSTPAINPIIT